MPGHVNPEAMIDVAEGRGGADELRESLRGLAAVEVPEPSPLYWEAFRRQVGGRLEAEARPARWSFLWLPGLAAAAAAIVAVVLLRPPVTSLPSPSGSVAMLPAWTPLPAGEQDDGLPVLKGLAAAGELTACGDLGGCLADLSDDDAAAVTAALRSEIEGRSQS